jgi:hypothetical protein
VKQTALSQQQPGADRTNFMNQLNAILKPEQRRAWTQLTGQAYDFQSQTFFPQQDVAPDDSADEQFHKPIAGDDSIRQRTRVRRSASLA